MSGLQSNYRKYQVYRFKLKKYIFFKEKIVQYQIIVPRSTIRQYCAKPGTVKILFGIQQLGMASALETLCGQAFGAKRYHMLGIYMQRSWIVLFLCCFLLLPVYIFAAPLMKLLGQPDDVAELSGVVARWLIPLHFSFAFQFPLQRWSTLLKKTFFWLKI